MLSLATAQFYCIKPVIGGLKYAYESFKKGDWVGVLTGVGEAVLDVALIVTTAGIGNAIKQSAKIGIKTPLPRESLRVV